MKKCSKCKLDKDFTYFSKNKARKDGFSNYCKPCDAVPRGDLVKRNEYNQRYRSENAEKIREKFKQKYKENKAEHKFNNDRWIAENRDKWKEVQRNYARTPKCKARHKAVEASRRAAKLNATVPGYDIEIKGIYLNCPDGYHVDHIVPLKGKDVCGLHVPWNLQYLPALENLKKNNKLILG